MSANSRSRRPRTRPRPPEEQRLHDLVASALAARYARRGHAVFINPGPTKVMRVRGKYPDVVVMMKRRRAVMPVIEVETRSSVSREEAARQWLDYDAIYDRWYLAVPKASRRTAKSLILEHDLQNVALITWSFDFDALP